MCKYYITFEFFHLADGFIQRILQMHFNNLKEAITQVLKHEK